MAATSRPQKAAASVGQIRVCAIGRCQGWANSRVQTSSGLVRPRQNPTTPPIDLSEDLKSSQTPTGVLRYPNPNDLYAVWARFGIRIFRSSLIIFKHQRELVCPVRARPCTEQKEKRNSFVFAPIFHERNSKLGLFPCIRGAFSSRMLVTFVGVRVCDRFSFVAVCHTWEVDGLSRC